MLYEQRSISQVVYNFLPDQVADLQSRVWKVQKWREPLHLRLDDGVVRGELMRALAPWIRAGLDQDLGRQLAAGMEIEIVTPSEDGVDVVPFPKLYRCRRCGQIERDEGKACVAGRHDAWATFPFVAYHTCGRLKEPFVPRCPQHDLVKCIFPESRNARDLLFTCPKCTVTISQGIPFTKCDCGDPGMYAIAPPRAGTVYAGHSAIVINPPTREIAAQFAGDAAKTTALDWALDGMSEGSPLDRQQTLEAMIQNFMQMKFSREVAVRMAEGAAANSGGKIVAQGTDIDLEGDERVEAIDGALKLTYATLGGRQTVHDLQARGEPTLRERYETNYISEIAGARLDSVHLLERFPVLTGFYGYSRGDRRGPRPPRLNWFRERSKLRLYSLRSETEGLLFTLDPVAVAAWLQARGHLLGTLTDPREARLAILRHAVVPAPGDELVTATLGSDLLTLVHTYSHRVLRSISAFCGIERDALAEYLIPLHLSFVIYANAKGDFVLGGLQALFENDLDRALREIVHGERRCALDPGCASAGKACVACLHVGEPSCRHYNRFLTRDVLFGSDGYLTTITRALAAT